MIKRWGEIWYSIGIAGTAIMVGLTGYVIVSIIHNPVSGRGGITELAVTTEVFQVTYVVLTVIILHRERRLRIIKENIPNSIKASSSFSSFSCLCSFLALGIFGCRFSSFTFSTRALFCFRFCL